VKRISQKAGEIKGLLSKGRRERILDFVRKARPPEIAARIDKADKYLKKKLFSFLPPEKGAEVIPELSEASLEQLLKTIGKKRIIEIAERMESDEATDLVEELSPSKRKAVLDSISREKAEDVKELLQYPEHTAGGLMQKECLAVRQGMAVSEAIEEIRSLGEKVRDVHYAFVVDEKNRLVGLLSLRKLILAHPNARISKLMNRDFISTVAFADQEEVAKKFKDYNIFAMPVVDEHNHLIGRITADDVIEVMEEESSEDMFRLAGLGEDESALEPLAKSVRKRGPWLLFNLLTAFIAASVVALFQSTIQAFVALAVFLPIIAGMGGNAGTQTLTVVTRGIALGEIDPSNAKGIIVKETIVGMAHGAIIGAVMAIVGVALFGRPLLGLIIFLAMTFNLLIAGLTGTIVPLALKALKQDPALASSVFVTTFTDICGFFALLGMAALLINYLV
jgi:magnesium transporter